MKSAYHDPHFAQFWNEISGRYGQTYKRYVLDPLCFKLLGNLKNKTVLDLGCGNGYLGPKFVSKGAKKVILMDISAYNLGHARKLNKSSKVEFLHLDATKDWPLDSKSLDVVFSDMMFNEIEDIAFPLEEAYRVLKKGGTLLFAVTHPAWDLYEFALESCGKSSEILAGVGPYFFRGYTKFIMSTNSLNPKEGEEYQKSFEVEHYQRPLQDYFEAILGAGFQVKRVLEPEIPRKVLKEFPGYQKMAVYPIGLIFHCQKAK